MSEKSKNFAEAWHNERGDNQTWWVDRNGLTNRLTQEAESLLRYLEVESDPVEGIRTIADIMSLCGFSETEIPVRYSEKTGKAVEFEWRQNDDKWKRHSWGDNTPLDLVGSSELRSALHKRGRVRANTDHGEVLAYWIRHNDRDGNGYYNAWEEFKLEFLPSAE